MKAIKPPETMMIDPKTGISLRMATYVQYHQTTLEFYSLYGDIVIRPNALTKILG